MSEQKDRVRAAFTAQADSYANSAVIAAEETRRGFITFIGPKPSHRVLDVATGPGFLALLFAERVSQVVGVDLTPAMVEKAKATGRSKDLTNVEFRLGDAENLPFHDNSFDITSCGSAFHHLPKPEKVLMEMVRVACPGGKVAIIDIISSEDPKKAALHNELERLRDPSHTRNLTLTEFVNMFEKAGLKDIRTSTYGTLRELGEWFTISKTPPEVMKKVHEAFLASIPGDGAGLNVHMEGEHVCFTHTFAWIVGSKKQ
jgi:SAM-dependent methyltransferase